MRQTVSAKVPFSKTNITRCMCPKCPVQGKSQCVSDKLSRITTALSRNPINASDIPGEYCSSGVATCQDINTNQSCICGTCPVFAEYKLAAGKPVGHYCRDGSAK